ncbi:MAG: TonB-dependent receptor [Burkholderiales bacterium]|nr:MAG: TonB-dependent receptor [Burkholderiales bacterium]
MSYCRLRFPHLLLGAGATAVFAGAMQPSFAQTARRQDAEITDATDFDTVVVTARKRDESAQSVPISVDVFDDSAVERLGVQTLEDLRYSSPSVYAAPSTFRQDTLNITIRGQQNFPSTGLQFDTSAAVYADGVYYARPVGLTGALFDIADVQVLKGPQGTLVGRNATGGAILYRTREPSSVFEGYGKVTIGDYGRREFQGAVNVPLTDTLAMRAALSASSQDGYVDNYFLDPASGYRNTTPGMTARRMAGQVALKWTPADDFSLLLRAKMAGESYSGVVYHDLGYFVGTTPAPAGRPSICNIPGTCIGFTDLLGRVVAPYYTNYLISTAVSTDPRAYNALLNSIARSQTRDFWSTEQAITNENVGQYDSYSALAEKSFGNSLNVRLLTAYRAFDNHGASAGRGLSYVTNINASRTPEYRSYQAELTFDGQALDDRLNWTAGLFYFRETSPNDGGENWLYLPNAGTPAPVAGRQITYTDQTSNTGANTSYAAYSQATYAVVPSTRLTAGLRFTVDERSALLTTRSNRFPATAASSLAVPNSVFDPGAYTLQGITYNGITRACALTDVNGVLLPPSECAVAIDKTFRKPTWTLALDHDLFENTLIYATARSGYRSGAINSSAINPTVVTADPEEVRDVEIGLKSDWSLLSVPLRTNLALYRSDYRDIQIQTNLPNVTLATAPGAPGGVCDQAAFNAGQCLGTTNDPVTLNAKRARIEGAEVSIAAKPLPPLTLEVSGSYLDAVYTDYSFTPPAGYLLPTGRVDLSGTPFPLPKVQLNASAIYSIAMPDLVGVQFDRLDLSYHIYHQSRFEADMRTFNPAQQTKAYVMSDARIDLIGLGGQNVDLSLFAKNVFNEEACIPEQQGMLNSAPNGTFGVARTSGALQCIPLPPRMAGASLRVSF